MAFTSEHFAGINSASKKLISLFIRTNKYSSEFLGWLHLNLFTDRKKYLRIYNLITDLNFYLFKGDAIEFTLITNLNPKEPTFLYFPHNSPAVSIISIGKPIPLIACFHVFPTSTSLSMACDASKCSLQVLRVTPVSPAAAAAAAVFLPALSARHTRCDG